MLDILLQLNKGQSWPQFRFNAPAHMVSDTDISAYQKNQHWHIDVQYKFELNYFDKSSNETVVDTAGNIVRDQSLEVCAVWYQGIKLNMHILSKMAKFYPLYRGDFIEYCKQNNIAVEQGPLHQTKFWHAGTWTTDFSKDFWWQYKKLKSNNEHNDYVGHSSETINANLQRLKELL